MSNEFGDFDLSKLDLEGGSKQESNNNMMDNYVKMPDKEGFLIVRLLPPMVAPDGSSRDPFCCTQLHYMGTYPSSKTYHCIRKRAKHPFQNKMTWVNSTQNPKDDCPICAEYTRLWKIINRLPEGDPEKDRLKAQARSYKGVPRYYWNCIVRSQINPKTNQKEENIGPKILSLPEQTHNLIITNIKGDPDAGIKALGNVTHPLTGRDFRIVKKIKKADGREFPNYELSRFEDPSPLGTEEQVAIWKANMHDLNALRVLLSPDELRSILEENSPGGAPKGNNWDEKPAAKQQEAPKAAKAPSKPAANVDLSDVVDEDFEAALNKLTAG
jgi:hypothetical protein